ncbi:MAG: enoyl-CoA hydratase/isomerase family protein [Burkholderiaceae bacterium]
MSAQTEAVKVRCIIEERVAVITLADPASRNAFTDRLLTELHQALDIAMASREVGAVLIRAEGPDFSAGGNLREMVSLPTRPLAQIEAEGRPIAELFKRLGCSPKPVIAAVHGSALGGGCGLACAATIALAADDARFGCPELRLGMFPFLLMPVLRRAVGDRNALSLALTGRVTGAAEAAALGLVSQVVAADALQSEALALARRIGSSSPDALRLGLQAFHETTDMDLYASMDRNLALRSTCCTSPNVGEGIRAFLEKRPARWNFDL